MGEVESRIKVDFTSAVVDKQQSAGGRRVAGADQFARRERDEIRRTVGDEIEKRERMAAQRLARNDGAVLSRSRQIIRRGASMAGMDLLSAGASTFGAGSGLSSSIARTAVAGGNALLVGGPALAAIALLQAGFEELKQLDREKNEAIDKMRAEIRQLREQVKAQANEAAKDFNKAIEDVEESIDLRRRIASHNAERTRYREERFQRVTTGN